MVQVQPNNKPPQDTGTNVASNCEDWENKPLLNRESFHTEFDTNAYLRDFYTNVDDPAMQLSLIEYVD
jgi:hypothetical protein